jgi:cytochrome c oxidase assembly protein Cox11
MRKLCKNKRGLSTVVSTILMIMVVMVGMSLLFGYVVFYTDSYKSGIGGSVMESLTVEDVWVQTDRTVQVSVYNAATKTNLGSDVSAKVASIS